MNVVSRKTLVSFYTKYPASKCSIEAWYTEAKKAEWKTPNEIKQRYPAASFLGDNRVVFNIKWNDFRLVAHIDYARKIVRVKFVGTHEEYDKINAEEI